MHTQFNRHFDATHPARGEKIRPGAEAQAACARHTAYM